MALNEQRTLFFTSRRTFLHAATAGLASGITPRFHAAAASPGPAFVVTGYLPWYRLKTWSANRAHLLTDLIYFGIRPTDDGQLPDGAIDKATLASLSEIKRLSGCRLHVCVGGGDRSAGFASLTAHRDRREAFVRRLGELCDLAGFNGIDYDWEHPEGATQLADYRSLLVETRRQSGDRILLSVAQSPWRDYGRAIYDAVDRVHVMSYNHKYPQARLADARADVDRMLKFGCPREKLVLGMPFYGRNRNGRSRTYAEIRSANGFRDDLDLIDGFAFNGRQTVRHKTRYARDERLAGVMIWEVGQDAPDPDRSLLAAIAAESK